MANFFKDKLGINIPVRSTLNRLFETDEEKKKREQAMVFRVGENLTPQETKRAETVVRKPAPLIQKPGDMNFFKDFVKSIPGAAQRVNQKAIVEPAQWTTSNVGSIGISAYKGLTESTPQFMNDAYRSFMGKPTLRRPISSTTDVLQPDNFLHKAVFGNQPVKGLSTRIDENQAATLEFGQRRNVPFLKTPEGAAKVGFVTPLLSAGLDLISGGGKKKLLDEASKIIAKTDDVFEIGKQLKRLGFLEDDAKVVQETLRTVNDPKVVQNVIENVARGINPSAVVQIVEEGGKSNKFYQIPKDGAEEIIKGLKKDGKFQVIQKTPLEMERLGFKNAGNLISEVGDTAKVADDIIPGFKPFVSDTEVLSGTGKVKTPIQFFDGNLDEFSTNADLLARETRKDNVLSELENAKPGRRLSVEVSGQGSTQEVFKEASTYPQWIPEDLRKASIVKPVVEHIKNGTLPSGKRQVELYDIIAERMGVSGSKGSALPLQSPQITSTTQKGSQSYGQSIPQEARMRQRGFLTSLKNKPSTATTFADEVDEYEQLANAKTKAKARDLINNDSAAANALAQSKDISVDAQAVRILMLEDAIAAGDINEAKRLAKLTNVTATEAGRAVQINRIMGQDLDDPAQALITAENMMDHHIKQAMPKLDYQVGKVEKQFNEVNNTVVDQIIKETPELKAPKAKTPKKETLSEMVEGRMFSPEEDLASRISPFMKKKKPDPVKDMVNTLFKLATEELPKKGKTPPKKAIDTIGEALRDNQTYREIWVKAQALVREKYAGNEKAMALLDKYFDKTLRSGVTVHADLPISSSVVTSAVKEGMKAEDINLGEIVRKHYSELDDTRKSLTVKLVEEANIPIKEATALTTKIEKRFNELATAKKESILKSIFSERKIGKDKSFVDRIIELTNLGAFNRAEFQEKLATKLGLPTMSDELAQKIIDQSNVLQGMEFGYQKHKETQKLLKMISDEIPVTKMEIAGQLVNIPRTLMSSFFDLSFGLRQGIVAAWGHPKEFANAFSKQFKAFAMEKHYENLMDIVMKDPTYKTAERAGVAFTDLGSTMGRREESYMSSYAEKIPLLGRGVRMTGRAYTGMANKLRMDMFSSMVKDAERLGLDLNDKALLENIAQFVNMATGRGDLGKLERIAPILNGIFFSPRLMAARLSLLNPVKYIKAEPFVRKQMIKSMLAFAGGSTLTLAALAQIPGVTVGADPRSADFGKIKIGDTRIDLLGGFQQYIRMAGQLITGEYISSTTGKLVTLGEGYKPLTRWDILWRQVESKEAPVASFITTLLKQQDYSGEPVSVTKEIAERFTPMVAASFYDLWKEDPELLPLGLLGVFGMGIQTYAKPDDLKALDEINKSADPAKAYEELKSSDPKLAEKVKDAKKVENYTDTDWKIKGKGVENGERAKMLLEEFDKKKSKEEKAALWEDLKKKGLLTDQVEKQVRFLLKNPDYEIPN